MNPPIEATKKEMLGSVSKAGVRIISDRLRNKDSLVNDDTYKHRMSLCGECSLYRSEGRCAKCGCVMRLKAKFKFASCPIGTWNAEKKSI